MKAVHLYACALILAAAMVYSAVKISDAMPEPDMTFNNFNRIGDIAEEIRELKNTIEDQETLEQTERRYKNADSRRMAEANTAMLKAQMKARSK